MGIMGRLGISPSILSLLRIPRKKAQSNGLLWVTMGYYGLLWVTMKLIETHRNSSKLIETHNTNLPKSTTEFLVRRGQICSIAKEDPLGIVHLVQPEGSYFWDGTKMCPLSQEISYTLNNHTPYKSNNHSDMPYSPDRTVDSDPYREYHP